MTPDEDVIPVITRLRALAEPVDPAVQAEHLSLMAKVPAAGAASRVGRGRILLAGGTLAFALIGGTGIAAAAGNLPDPVQNAAHGALKKVGVKVPKGTPVACEDAVNHGQYVRSQPKGGAARSAAAKSDCGKKAKDADENENETKAPTDETTGKADKGKPADAGKPAETPAADKTDDTPAADKPAAPDAPGKAKQQQNKPAKP